MTIDPAAVIDAHIHVWRRDRAGYDWLDQRGFESIANDRSVDGALPALRAAGVGAALLVQAADADGDTDVMLEEAAAHPSVAGVVAWLPLDAPSRAGARLDEIRARGPVVGVRALVHDEPDPRYVLRPQVLESLRLVADSGLPFDFVTADSDALALLPALAEAVPDLTIVLDHLGKPPVRGDLDAWDRLLTTAAQNPRLVAKISGLYPLNGDGIDRAVELAVDRLGCERLMYGSDWPLVELDGGYIRWWQRLQPFLDRLAPEERSAVLSLTARRVYLGGPAPRRSG